VALSQGRFRFATHPPGIAPVSGGCRSAHLLMRYRPGLIAMLDCHVDYHVCNETASSTFRVPSSEIERSLDARIQLTEGA